MCFTHILCKSIDWHKLCECVRCHSPLSLSLPNAASVPGVVPDHSAQPSIGRYSQQQQHRPQPQPQPLVRPVWVCVCMCLTVCNWTAQFSFAFVSCCIFYTVPRPSAVAHAGCACEAKFVSSSCLLLYSIFHTASCFAATYSPSLSHSLYATYVTHFVGCRFSLQHSSNLCPRPGSPDSCLILINVRI